MAIEATHLVKPLIGTCPAVIRIGPSKHCNQFYIVASGFGDDIATELRTDARGDTPLEAEQKWNNLWRQQIRGQQL